MGHSGGQAAAGEEEGGLRDECVGPSYRQEVIGMDEAGVAPRCTTEEPCSCSARADAVPDHQAICVAVLCLLTLCITTLGD